MHRRIKLHVQMAGYQCYTVYCNDDEAADMVYNVATWLWPEHIGPIVVHQSKNDHIGVHWVAEYIDLDGETKWAALFYETKR